MVQEQYVSFETAKLLKEKGFCQDLPYFYNENGEIIKNNYDLVKVYPYVSQSLAMRWLREVHNIYIRIGFVIPEKLWAVVYKDVQIYVVDNDEADYTTYEEAFEDAIKYCLENFIQ